jgi:hypothetical protein
MRFAPMQGPPDELDELVDVPLLEDDVDEEALDALVLVELAALEDELVVEEALIPEVLVDEDACDDAVEPVDVLAPCPAPPRPRSPPWAHAAATTPAGSATRKRFIVMSASAPSVPEVEASVTSALAAPHLQQRKPVE